MIRLALALGLLVLTAWPTWAAPKAVLPSPTSAVTAVRPPDGTLIRPAGFEIPLVVAFGKPYQIPNLCLFDMMNYHWDQVNFRLVFADYWQPSDVVRLTERQFAAQFGAGHGEMCEPGYEPPKVVPRFPGPRPPEPVR